MNERIMELAEQATSTQGPTPYNPLTFEVFDKEKFAELIVRECANAIKSNQWAKGDQSWSKGMQYSAELIKEHFGVKE